MFGLYFGEYLVKKNLIDITDLKKIMLKRKTSRVKLGFIAVSEKMLTKEQANELNYLQAQHDRRFGDLAIEKDYLTFEQVNHLLGLQTNPYLLFVQTLTEDGYMTAEEIDMRLSAFQRDNNYTTKEIEALKSGDIDRIAPIFIQIREPFYNDHIGLALRSMVRFITSNYKINPVYSTYEYEFEYMASQCIDGEHSIFFAFSGKDKALLSIAQAFAKEEFSEIDEDALDSVNEFINCINGLHISKLSRDNVELDLLPPISYFSQKIVSDGPLYVVPLVVNGDPIDLLISVDTAINIV